MPEPNIPPNPPPHTQPNTHQHTTAWWVLVNHFFRRFFDNDTVQVEGDTLTTVVRALSATMVPGLMVAFFLQNRYPQRTPEDVLKDYYFFILLSFVVMGIVALFEWEMLFPDRLDFLVLSPLPPKPWEILSAKAAALMAFIGIFLVATNLFGMLILPAVSHGNFWRQVLAHGLATLLAGLFAVLFFLALGGVLRCVLSAQQFRWVSSLVQMVAVCGLVLLALHYVLLGDFLLTMLQPPAGWVRWLPSVWFLGIYEQVLHGNAAPAFAAQLSSYAVRATLGSAVVALLAYPFAWVRARRAAIEGATGKRLGAWPWTDRLLYAIVRQPGERAVFAFIRQTLARNNRYQVYLAMYCGTGAALAIACSVSFRAQAGHIHMGVSSDGMHAVTPLMMFWVVAGLRAAFGLPVNLAAGWIFRVTGAKLSECAAAARSWAMMCAMAVMTFLLVVFYVLGWDARQLFVQAGTGFCLALLLTNAFFSSPDRVPFNKPRMPGKSSLALLLTLYFGVLPPFVFWMMGVEKEIEHKLTRAVGWTLVTCIALLVMVWLRRRSPLLEEDWAEYSGEYLLLGLSQQ